jgi:aarF domain-containing kinase
MSIARALVDIIGVASSTTKIGYGMIATQSAALQQHLKTSSLVNPTPTIVHSTLPDHSPQPTDTLAEHGLDTLTSANHSATDAPHGTFDAGLPPLQDSVTAPIEATATTTTTPIVNEPPTTTQASSTIEESISKPQQVETPLLDAQQPEQVLRQQLKEARIPTSRAGRLWHYGSLATGMGLGAINESFRRATGLSKDQQGKDEREKRMVIGN